MFRNLWEHIRKDMPKKGRGKAEDLDPLSLPRGCRRRSRRSTATTRRPSSSGRGAGIRVPPCFIVVCNNTSTSKLVYDYISGFHRQNDDGRLQHAGERPPRALPQLRRARQPARAAQHAAHRQRAARIRRGARRQLPRAWPPTRSSASAARSSSARAPRTRSAENITDQDSAARGHEHRRQAGPARRLHPLRRLRLDAHRGLGRQHRHPRPRRARLRHAAPLRAGHRPRAAPPVVRPERRGPVQRRVRRRPRHPLRLHGQAGRRAAAAAARDHSGQGDAPRARRARDPLSRASRATASSCPRSA